VRGGGPRTRSDGAEIGCGTGQLTRSLLARGLRVLAVEPGERLIARARDSLGRSGGELAEDRRCVARPGTVALLSYIGVEDPRSTSDQHALRASLARIAPELAAEGPPLRPLDAPLEGAAERRGNLSEAWAWLSSHEVARAYACALFEDAQLDAMPMLVEQTADELNAVLGTMSFWARLSPGQGEAVRTENRALHERLGRPIRSSIAACLVTARRARGGATARGIGSGCVPGR
jgi:hypothetical protein